jgi:hypothetical protein
MYNILNNNKPILYALIKLAIVIGAFYYIFQKLATNQQLSLFQLQNQLSVLFAHNIWVIIVLLLFTDVNWLLEIFKWKTLVSAEKEITFMQAYEQCLASLTTSLITPNRIGEYGAKTLYFSKGKRKNIMILNLAGNLSQLSITIFFGLIGILFLFQNFKFQIPVISKSKIIIISIIIVGLFLFRKKLKLHKLKEYFGKLPFRIYSIVISLSFFRYLVFTHQFIFLLRLFGVETDYLILLNLLFCMYFIASIIPSLSIFDWVIKGSIAVWLFGFIGINELTIVTVTTLMWILNFAIPALIGSIFVLNFKPTIN